MLRAKHQRTVHPAHSNATGFFFFFFFILVVVSHIVAPELEDWDWDSFHRSTAIENARSRAESRACHVGFELEVWHCPLLWSTFCFVCRGVPRNLEDNENLWNRWTRYIFVLAFCFLACWWWWELAAVKPNYLSTVVPIDSVEFRCCFDHQCHCVSVLGWVKCSFFGSFLLLLLASVFILREVNQCSFFPLSVRFAADLGCDGIAHSVPVGVAYAEIVVMRHRETEWNADGRIQVVFASGFLFSLPIL